MSFGCFGDWTGVPEMGARRPLGSGDIILAVIAAFSNAAARATISAAVITDEKHFTCMYFLIGVEALPPSVS